MSTRLNDLKQNLFKDENPLKAMVDFLKINIPCYLEMLNTCMPFIKTTHDSLAELFALLDKKPLKLGEPIELWGSKSKK